jgi:hypothetical protein
MKLTREFSIANVAIACYVFAVVAFHFVLKITLQLLKSEGVVAMIVGFFYSYGTSILFDLVPLVCVGAGTFGVAIECRHRNMSPVLVWCFGIAAGLVYALAGVLLVYGFFNFIYPKE